MALNWKKIEGWFEQSDYDALAALPLPETPTIVECGTYKGRSTAAIAKMWPKSYIVTCDLNEDRPHDLTGQAEFHQCRGDKLHFQGKIDLLFIDDSHYYDDIKASFYHFLPQIKPGGYVAFHDYCFETDDVAGVRRFVDELGGCTIKKGKYGMAIWRKPQEKAEND